MHLVLLVGRHEALAPVFSAYTEATSEVRLPLQGERLPTLIERELLPKKTLYRDSIYEHAQWLVESYTWAIYRWNYTYGENLIAFVTADTTIATEFVATVEAHEQSYAWRKRKTPDRLLLAHYGDLIHSDDFHTTLQGALFFDHKREGSWAWEHSEREAVPPYLILGSGDSDLSLEKRAALRWCPEVVRSQETRIVLCKDPIVFRTLCGTGQNVDPFYGYVVSGLANPKALLRQLAPSGEYASHLHELRRLGEVAGWAYSWQWGGGDGEFHATFWARDPQLTNNLWQEVGDHSLSHRSIKPLARF